MLRPQTWIWYCSSTPQSRFNYRIFYTSVTTFLRYIKNQRIAFGSFQNSAILSLFWKIFCGNYGVSRIHDFSPIEYYVHIIKFYMCSAFGFVWKLELFSYIPILPGLLKWLLTSLTLKEVCYEMNGSSFPFQLIIVYVLIPIWTLRFHPSMDIQCYSSREIYF